METVTISKEAFEALRACAVVLKFMDSSEALRRMIEHVDRRVIEAGKRAIAETEEKGICK